jgi:hypothetical protein
MMETAAQKIVATEAPPNPTLALFVLIIFKTSLSWSGMAAR